MSDSDGPDTPGQQVTIPRSRERSLRAGDGFEYRVLIAWPSEPPPPAGYPVIYLLDANATFATLVETIRTRSSRSASTGVLPALVVGVAYPVDGPYDRERRRFDFSTCAPPQSDDEAAQIRETGGAPEFQDFLENTLRPAVARDFHTDPARQTLFGHSLGALFVLETLIRSPGSYSDYVAISPSVWWAREKVLAGAGDYARSGADARVVIAVGEYEEELAPWQRPSDKAALERLQQRRSNRRMVSDAGAVARALGSNVHFTMVPGEDHSSVVTTVLGGVLRVVLAPR